MGYRIPELYWGRAASAIDAAVENRGKALAEWLQMGSVVHAHLQTDVRGPVDQSVPQVVCSRECDSDLRVPLRVRTFRAQTHAERPSLLHKR